MVEWKISDDYTVVSVRIGTHDPAHIVYSSLAVIVRVYTGCTVKTTVTLFVYDMKKVFFISVWVDLCT